MPFFSNKVILTIFVSSMLMFYSCGDPEVAAVDETGVDENSSIRYGSESLQLPELTPGAQAEVANWPAFDDFYEEMSSMNGNTLNSLKIKTERLLLHTDSLSKKIPNVLYTQPITSRLIVLNSRVNLLNQVLNKGKTDSTEIANQLEELTSAATNFLVQINEKLQKDKIDLERVEDEKKELEKQKRFLDSVYKAERADLNRQKL